MAYTNYPNGITSFGVPIFGGPIVPAGNVYWVKKTTDSDYNIFRDERLTTYADGTNSIYNTIQAAITAATSGRGDIIYVLPGEYNEDITHTKTFLRIVGVGARHSVRITGTSAGTKTAMTLSGVQDAGLYNLNLEGRTSSGSALVLTGQNRRIEVVGCKIHGGDSAIKIDVPALSQTVDVRFEDNIIANSAIGLFIDYSGGDPCHQIHLKGNTFSKITTDCIVEDGATHDWQILGNYFTAADGTEPTQFLDIDETGSTGFVANNFFATTVFSTAKFAIASGVLFANNISQAENPSAGVGGTSGRPD